MDTITLRPASVGSLVKKLLAINPSLTTLEIIGLVRQATRTHESGEGLPFETVDEIKALELARKTLEMEQNR